MSVGTGHTDCSPDFPRSSPHQHRIEVPPAIRHVDVRTEVGWDRLGVLCQQVRDVVAVKGEVAECAIRTADESIEAGRDEVGEFAHVGRRSECDG